MDEEMKMLKELLEAAGTRTKASKPGTPEHAEAMQEYVDLSRILNDRLKIDIEANAKAADANLREVDERERRRLDEKKIDIEADTKLKEMELEDRKLKITPGMIFQASTAVVVTLAVLCYEKTGVITTKAFSNWFRKVI